MYSPDFSNATIVFDDPRLRMTGAGRLLVRVTAYISYLFLVVATVTLLLSDITSLRATGALLALFLIDRARRSGCGDCSIKKLSSAGTINAKRCISPRTFAILERAFDKSGITRVNVLIEVARDILRNSEVSEGLSRLEVSLSDFDARLDALAKSDNAGDSREERRRKLGALATTAFARAINAHHEFIQPSDFFAALASQDDLSLQRLFGVFSLSEDDIAAAMLFGELTRHAVRFRPPVSLGGFAKVVRRGVRHRVMNRAWTARPTPTLDRYGTDFTDLARAGSVGFLVGHDEEFSRLLDVLARSTSSNALLVGDAGAGKEAMIANLAFRLITDEVPSSLFDKRLVGIDLSLLVAGASSEDLHARVAAIVEEITDAGNIILYLPDMHNLIKTTSAASLSVADVLIPVLMDNSFSVVGTTYPRDYAAHIETRSDFSGLLEVIRVNEINERDAVTVLIYDAVIIERKFRMRVTLAAVKSAVMLSKKYLREKLLPSSASELLRNALALAERRGESMLRREDVIRAMESRVNVPVHEATGDEAQRLLHLEDIIHERMIDQDEAVRAVADALREYRSGLSRKGGPIAAFLFVGPTGVGKTELAKNLARVHFGSEQMMVRFDMTEYQDAESIRRFIGAPDGSTNGALTRAVMDRPYSVILLDEFEKAHADILNLFLQVFDDGRLTDSIGRTVSFENTILIATSNAHSDIIIDALRQGQGMTDVAEYLKSRLTDVFRPELINRFSKIVVFKNLNIDDLNKIAALQIKEVAFPLAEQGIKFEVDASAIDLLTKQGYEPEFGARPLRRVIEEKIRAPLAQEILKGSIVRGVTVKIIAEGEEFKFIPREQ
ncbi:MAG: ATP-dependent Clp protease ATP-binding subunit [Patescibacteria group bacterium]|nr:ATP-dependent Clp protease ATP-binding subunit [Patescibacteria group bacterium]